MRRSELCGLKWTDINWEHGSLYIQRSVVKLAGYDILIHDTKNNSSRRVIPLPKFVLDILYQYKQSIPKAEYIFSRPNGQPIYPEVIYDYVKSLGRKLGIPFITVHMLRHTAATLLLEAGQNPKVVQELLGHSSFQVTMDIYSHVSTGLKQ